MDVANNPLLWCADSPLEAANATWPSRKGSKRQKCKGPPQPAPARQGISGVASSRSGCVRIAGTMTSWITALCLFAATLPCVAQTKPTLQPDDYGKWETLGASTLSPDGKWLAYDIRRTSGSNELRVSAVAGGNTHTLESCTGPAFSADSRWVACLAGANEESGGRGGRGASGGARSQTKLHLMDLDSGKSTTVDDVQTFAFAGSGEYLAFRKFPPAAPAATANA